MPYSIDTDDCNGSKSQNLWGTDTLELLRAHKNQDLRVEDRKETSYNAIKALLKDVLNLGVVKEHSDEYSDEGERTIYGGVRGENTYAAKIILKEPAIKKILAYFDNVKTEDADSPDILD